MIHCKKINKKIVLYSLLNTVLMVCDLIFKVYLNEEIYRLFNFQSNGTVFFIYAANSYLLIHLKVA